MGPVRIFIFIFIAASFLVSAVMSYGNCPPKNKVMNSKPVCHSDADCTKWGQICCPNQFNTKSCTPRAPWSHDSSAKPRQLIRM
ncbi:unnamed protein product [Spodoptera exigua]|nr:unnamed protein product [Spodoptera exigua]